MTLHVYTRASPAQKQLSIAKIGRVFETAKKRAKKVPDVLSGTVKNQNESVIIKRIVLDLNFLQTNE
jgi:hypothetical protein